MCIATLDEVSVEQQVYRQGASDETNSHLYNIYIWMDI